MERKHLLESLAIKKGGKYVVLAKDGPFLSLGETSFFSEESHGWDKEVTRKFSGKFLCPIEFME